MNDRDRPRLMLAPSSGNPLLQPRRVPGEIAVDNHAGGLKVKACAAGIGAQENPAARIVFKALDLSTPAGGTDPVWRA